jgi:KaiC/GvpD/RAD55 family RecA-like ATPase
MTIVTTGVQGLDSQLGGGIHTGSTVLCLSEPSNAPYMLNEQFAAGGLNTGETVYYYAIDRPKDDVVEHIKAYLIRDVEAKLVFFDAYALKLRNLPPAAIKKLGVTNHAVKVTDDVVPRILADDGKRPFRIIIESLTEVYNAYGEKEAMKLVESVSGVIRQLNATALLTMTAGVADAQFEARIKHLVDGVVEFGLDRQGFGLYTFLSISKMRGVQDAAKLLLYKETEKGLWFESTRRVQ